MTAPALPACCAPLARIGVKCNAHRTESISAGVIRRARAAGYSGTDPLEAERFLGLRPVVIG